MAPSEIDSSGHLEAADGVFEIDTVRAGPALWLRLSGELDLASVERLEEAISVAEEGTARVIVIDLADLEFMDSAGLTVLLQAHSRTRQDGQRLRFVPSEHDGVTQLVAVTGTSEIFD
jgi:anti-sigma B factor antagonist